jgi:adenylate cyclase
VKVSLQTLAERTGEPVERLEEWRRRGFLTGHVSDVAADAEKVRLIRFLLGRGFKLEQIAKAHDQQDNLLDRFLTFLYPWGALPEYSFDEIANKASIDPELAQRLWTAAGLSQLEDAGGEEDVRTLAVLAMALDAGLPESAIVQLARVYVDSLGRVAEAEVRLFHFYVHERLRADGLSGPELTEATQALSRQLQAAVEPTVLYFHRKGWTSAVRDDLALHVSQELESAEAPEVPGTLRATVVFTDLARFTPLTEAMGDVAAADVVERFSEIVRTATNRWHGRVVKQIGDEFMLMFFEPRSAIACALEIDEQATNETQFPAVRSGAHWGDVLYREGDYVGTTVNIASRLAAQATAHELIITSTLSDMVENRPDAECVAIGRQALKGLSQELELCVVRRKTEALVERLVDPVCGMELDPGDVVARLDVAGGTQVFCSNECLQLFVATPDRYAT